jgi:hypothetical protein
MIEAEGLGGACSLYFEPAHGRGQKARSAA